MLVATNERIKKNQKKKSKNMKNFGVKSGI